MIIFLKFEIRTYSKIAKAGVIKKLTIPLTIETTQQIIIKPWKRSPGPWCLKNEKFKKIQNFKELQVILKIADIKILKIIQLHLEAMQ